MAKPVKTPPHSDLDGVHEDEMSPAAAANAAGQDAGDLKRAKEQALGRPPASGTGARKDD